MTQQLSQNKQLNFLTSAELHEIYLITGHLVCNLSSRFLCAIWSPHMPLCSVLTLLFNVVLEVLARKVRPEKEMSISNYKEVELSLLTDDMILYT